MKARPNLRFAGATVTATRIDLATTDATETPALEVSAVVLKTFDQTPDYTRVAPVLVPAGKSKRTWRWALNGARLWRITADDEVLYVQTTPAGVVRLDETEALTLLRDEFARSLGYPTYQAWQDANATYLMARESANREARDDALRQATDYVLKAKWPTLVGSPADKTLGDIAREGMVRIAKGAILYNAAAIKVSKRGTKVTDAKVALKALERCRDAAWFVVHRHAFGKPGAKVDLDRVLSKLATLDVPSGK
jgi:hypothetical protein